MQPALDDRDREKLASTLASAENDAVAFVRETGTGYCRIDLVGADPSAETRVRIAAVASVVQAQWAWDESETIAVTMRGREVRVAARNGSDGWDASVVDGDVRVVSGTSRIGVSPYREPGRAPAALVRELPDPLGALERVYRAPKWRGGSLYYVLVTVFAVMATFILLIVLALSSSVGVGFLAIVCGVAITVAVLVWPARHQAVFLHANGVDVHDGRRAEQMLWGSVRFLYRSDQPFVSPADASGPVEIALVDHEGRRVVLSRHLPGIEALAETLKLQLSVPLLRGARAAMADGEPLVFGVVTIDRDGIAFGGRRIAWRDVRDVRVVATFAVVRERDAIAPWARLPIADIPHPRVFWALVKDRTPSVGAGGARSAGTLGRR